MLRIGLVGCGAISEVHLEAINKNKNAQLVSLCDLNKKTLKKITNKYSCKGYLSYSDMLEKEKLDIVHICTPHFLHKDMIIEALNRNINVISEKPIVMNKIEGYQVEKALSISKGKLGVAFQNRYNPTSLKIKKYIEDKKLGELKALKAFLTWERKKEYYTESNWKGKHETEGGGFLINQAIHTIDLMQWFGGEVLSVDGSCSTRTLSEYISVEDTAEIFLKFHNQRIGLFYGTNGYVENSPVQIDILFEYGLLRYLNGKLYLEDQNKDFILLEKDNNSTNNSKEYWGSSHKKLINSFYTAIKDNTNDYISFKEGMKSISILEGIINN